MPVAGGRAARLVSRCRPAAKALLRQTLHFWVDLGFFASFWLPFIAQRLLDQCTVMMA